ncbi:MAG TPA: hypothetical protein VNL17_04780 [Verrucomicrobiae bacterium]|nr:hypothetical protein [Verrucomicrobiae bacterium]
MMSCTQLHNVRPGVPSFGDDLIDDPHGSRRRLKVAEVLCEGRLNLLFPHCDPVVALLVVASVVTKLPAMPPGREVASHRLTTAPTTERTTQWQINPVSYVTLGPVGTTVVGNNLNPLE